MSVGRIFGWVLIGAAGSLAIVQGLRHYVDTQVPVKLRAGGSVETSLWERGYVTANGTWVAESGEDARPLQYTSVACYRSDNTCRSATAEVLANSTLSLDTATYKVAQWSDTTLMFVNSDSPCTDFTYTISRANQRVVGTRAPKRSLAEYCTEDERTVQLTLVDGAKVTKAQEQEADARAQPVAWASLAALWVSVLSGLFRRPGRSMELAEA
jgi:hypothetical protein